MAPLVHWRQYAVVTYLDDMTGLTAGADNSIYVSRFPNVRFMIQKEQLEVATLGIM